MRNLFLSITLVLMALSAKAQTAGSDYYFKIKWEQHNDSTWVKIPQTDVYISLSDSVILYKGQLYQVTSLYRTDDLYSTYIQTDSTTVSISFTKDETSDGRYIIGIDEFPITFDRTKSLTTIKMYEAKRVKRKVKLNSYRND
ncbi:MAG: hypothetical protein J6T98_09115 [Salinivirgaceae bacterium]|nr:hypothetical protein [Salinivirgaceae bacterium]